jgi:hypothetical protein
MSSSLMHTVAWWYAIEPQTTPQGKTILPATSNDSGALPSPAKHNKNV